MVVDDDPESLSYLETLLKSRDFTVTTARDGREARDKILQHKYDLLITDIQMPGFNGFELASLIKERGMHLPIIMVSAMATLATLDKAISIGAITLLKKPINTGMLVISINKALEEKEHIFKKHKKVLIADDNDEFRQSVSHFIEMAGYDIVNAIDGKEALKIAQEANPHFDIALIDEVMPGMSGHQVIHKLKEISPDTLPVLLSGEATSGEIAEAYEEGAFSFIRKPVDFSALLQCMVSYEREADELRKKVEMGKAYYELPFYKKLYYLVKEYIDAPPNSPKNLQLRIVWVSIMAIVIGVAIFYMVIKLQEYAEETQAKIDKTTELLEQANEYRRSRDEEMERSRKDEFYRRMNDKSK